MPSPVDRAARAIRVLEPDAATAFVPATAHLAPPVAAMVGALLRVARDQLGLEAATVAELRADRQRVLHLESVVPLPLAAGDVVRRDAAIAQLVVAGRLPAVLGDVAAHPVARTLPASLLLPVGAYVCVPRTLDDGTLVSVCAMATTPRPGLGDRELALLGVVADEVVRAIGRTRGDLLAARGVRDRIEELLDEGGPRVVCQPVHDLATGRRAGVEVLARFDDGRAPDVWFAEAAAHGIGIELELAVARRAALLFDRLPGAIGINLSARAITDPRVGRLLAALPADRLVVELTEHERVDDYDAVARVLTPLRRRGASLAVDDTGAGFASLQHVLRLGPDWIKLDRDLVHDVDVDPARAALLAAMVAFAERSGMRICVEGVETADEAAAVGRLGAHCAQGYHLGRPVPPHEVPGFLGPRVPAPRAAARVG